MKLEYLYFEGELEMKKIFVIFIILMFALTGCNQETSEYVIISNSFAGGFGGAYNGASIFSMQNGELVALYHLESTYIWDGEESLLFTVNGEEVCHDVHTQISSRFLLIPAIYHNYILYDLGQLQP